MEREELLQEVQGVIEEDGKQLSPSLSEESINGELDDALEDITEDEESNKKVISRLAKRLLRMDGNLHSDISKQVTEYKKTHKFEKKTEKKTDDEDNKSDMQKLMERLDRMEQAQKKKDELAAKDAIVAKVKKSFIAKFKEADLAVNDYILRQTMRDMEIPDAEEGESVKVDELVKGLERDYIRNLKEAGLGKESTGKSRFGSREGARGESAATRFFQRKGKREGWKK